MAASVRILLVDPVHEDRRYFAHHLAACSPDYEIFEAADGRSGLHLYRSRQIDCVVLELDLPDISGFELLAGLIPDVRCPEVAAIVLTGLTNQRLMIRAIQNGAQIVLEKASISGGLLDKTIVEAISAVGKNQHKVMPLSFPMIGFDVRKTA